VNLTMCPPAAMTRFVDMYQRLRFTTFLRTTGSQTFANPAAQALQPAGSRLVSTLFFPHRADAGTSAGAAD
jgi:hypothetical protein